MDIHKRNFLKKVATGLLFVIICILQWLSLELSMTAFHHVMSRAFFSSLLSFCVVAEFNAALLLLLGRVFQTQIISAVICGLISVANHYVVLLHGSPLRISELRSSLTAINVMHGYSLTIDQMVFLLLGLLFVQVSLLLLEKEYLFTNSGHGRVRAYGAVTLAVCAAILVKGFSSSEWRPFITWSWDYAAKTYGYPACLVEDTIQFHSRYTMPEGYSNAKLQELVSKTSKAHTTNGQNRPDIILILNETFYDPIVYKGLALETDVPYLENFYRTENAIWGYNAVPYGGTNSTEYELLTSNSKSLINPSAPFACFPLNQANSIVNYLKTLGYETWAFHNAKSENYLRNTAYPALGFDHVMFRQGFLPLEYYGNRSATDSQDYEQIIKAYEQAPDSPRFMYILTYQNHGGYQQNPEAYDLVHVLDDYGSNTDDMNEFLTSISMSDSAWAELIDYFSNVERDVMIIMTGDHPPFFLFEQSGREFAQDGNVQTYALNNMTPYIIWSNFVELEAPYHYITCSDLIPYALACAGVPLSRYYEQILAVQEKLPVHMGDCYFDREDNCYQSIEGTEAEEVLQDYYYMEYNNLLDPPKRIQQLFVPEWSK